MLTKEFAQRVKLSEKQVRKIVQHLEERGYQLSKTEYRGREATDFKEEDIELFQDIAEKVKQTNSYDLAFEELEKEKDFLQVIVKEDQQQLPANQGVTQLVEDLRTEIQKMREERQMLGQMITQVHQQQNESLAAIQTSQQAIQTAQKEQSDYTKNNLVKEINDNNQQAIDNLKEHQTYVSSSNEKKGFLARLFNL